jgi:hypothetical protein
MPKLHLWIPPFDVVKYKREYYKKHNDIYRERNRKASSDKTIERIEALSTPEIIYKLKYIIDN